MTTSYKEASSSEFTPLGLPKGSVRALASLIVVGTAWLIILMGKYEQLAVETEFVNVVILVVSFYFGVRRTTVGMTGGDPIKSADPLNLPRRSIRTIMLFGFSIAIIFVALDAESWTEIPSFLFTAFLVIMGYFVGLVLHEVIERLFKDEKTETGHDKLIRNLKALALLGFTIIICGLYLWGVMEDETTHDYFGNLLAVAISLYYGVRN
ncbi:MAG: hypothetical protein ACE5OZ_06010 [Candidatus Heimdallarchaeota archaeon]